MGPSVSIHDHAFLQLTSLFLPSRSQVNRCEKKKEEQAEWNHAKVLSSGHLSGVCTFQGCVRTWILLFYQIIVDCQPELLPDFPVSYALISTALGSSHLCTIQRQGCLEGWPGHLCVFPFVCSMEASWLCTQLPRTIFSGTTWTGGEISQLESQVLILSVST